MKSSPPVSELRGWGLQMSVNKSLSDEDVIGETLLPSVLERSSICSATSPAFVLGLSLSWKFAIVQKHPETLQHLALEVRLLFSQYRGRLQEDKRTSVLSTLALLCPLTGELTVIQYKIRFHIWTLITTSYKKYCILYPTFIYIFLYFYWGTFSMVN